MSWIFENIQIIIIVGSTIAWWLTQRNQDSGDTPPPMDRPGREKIDVEQLERTRRLREEIRRKREARRSGEVAEPVPQMREAPQPEPPQIPREVTEQMPPVLRDLMGIPEPEPPPPVPPPIPEVNPVAERQRRLEAEMAELEAKRREAEAVAANVKVAPGAKRPRRRRTSSATSLDDRDFLATLRDPAQARRAIVLRDILSKPVGLR